MAPQPLLVLPLGRDRDRRQGDGQSQVELGCRRRRGRRAGRSGPSGGQRHAGPLRLLGSGPTRARGARSVARGIRDSAGPSRSGALGYRRARGCRTEPRGEGHHEPASLLLGAVVQRSPVPTVRRAGEEVTRVRRARRADEFRYDGLAPRPRSSVDQSNRLLSGRSQVRILPGTPHHGPSLSGATTAEYDRAMGVTR
jgi:hypothetical protein